MFKRDSKTIVAFFALLFSASAFSQAAPASLPASCGTKNITFDVNLDHSQHTLTQPESGKARVYFVQDLGSRNPVAVISVALDGAWVGANKNDSYFSVSVEPGEHHVCENVKSRYSAYGRLVELAHFTAQAGKVYYVRAQLLFGENQPFLHLDLADSDQGEYLIASYPLSVSRPKK